MKIRKARKDDFDSVVKLFQEADGRTKKWAVDRTTKFLNSSNKCILLAFEGKKPIGFVGIKKEDKDPRTAKFIDSKNTASVSWIALLENYRGKGYGSKLLNRADIEVKNFRKKQVWLDCRKRVLPFYIRNGYKVKGYFIKEVKGKKRRQYILLKRLK